MKAIIAGIKSIEISINKVFFVKLFIIAAISVAIIAVKISSIKTGYQISKISSRLKEARIRYESLKRQEYKITDVYLLTEKADDMGLKLMDVGRTFYVK
ncbi:MAG: hypothetical protein PWQ25_1254 [Deferribacteres bacterium]|nr:hypothetical protein [Deferribacteres bacterium]